ncbi:hypothetical protein [Croceimicrobium sp.]|uniref:hypothetical protein n=1 Tax=Croceimicrobium sp. TaxID=2828340 RepID=UPI003BAAD2E0
MDSDIGDFVLQIKSSNASELLSILTAFQHYVGELSPLSLPFNSKGFFEILEHNGADHEEGWMSDFAYFNFEQYSIFSELKPYQTSNWHSSRNYSHCQFLLKQIQEQGIPAYHPELSAKKFKQMDELLKFGINNSLQQIINFLNAYYLERPDLESMKAQHGKSYNLILNLGDQLRHEIQNLMGLKRIQ